MTVDLTFSIGNILALISLIGFFFWVRFNMDRVLQVLFSPNGSVRLISFEAHDRMQEQCHMNLRKDAGYASADMARIEKMLADQSVVIGHLSGKMDALGRCISALKYGADGTDLENC
jgi:hypothetical protein